uniref:Uncharacterized protein n=1 Tax=Panagrolaimus sp. ES5 TaxID=591445 RepID=A0AC34F4Y7_9BILA
MSKYVSVGNTESKVRNDQESEEQNEKEATDSQQLPIASFLGSCCEVFLETIVIPTPPQHYNEGEENVVAAALPPSGVAEYDHPAPVNDANQCPISIFCLEFQGELGKALIEGIPMIWNAHFPKQLFPFVTF